MSCVEIIPGYSQTCIDPYSIFPFIGGIVAALIPTLLLVLARSLSSPPQSIHIKSKKNDDKLEEKRREAAQNFKIEQAKRRELLKQLDGEIQTLQLELEEKKVELQTIKTDADTLQRKNTKNEENTRLENERRAKREKEEEKKRRENEKRLLKDVEKKKAELDKQSLQLLADQDAVNRSKEEIHTTRLQVEAEKTNFNKLKTNLEEREKKLDIEKLKFQDMRSIALDSQKKLEIENKKLKQDAVAMQIESQRLVREAKKEQSNKQANQGTKELDEQLKKIAEDRAELETNKQLFEEEKEKTVDKVKHLLEVEQGKLSNEMQLVLAKKDLYDKELQMLQTEKQQIQQAKDKIDTELARVLEEKQQIQETKLLIDTDIAQLRSKLDSEKLENQLEKDAIDNERSLLEQERLAFETKKKKWVEQESEIMQVKLEVKHTKQALETEKRKHEQQVKETKLAFEIEKKNLEAQVEQTKSILEQKNKSLQEQLELSKEHDTTDADRDKLEQVKTIKKHITEKFLAQKQFLEEQIENAEQLCDGLQNEVESLREEITSIHHEYEDKEAVWVTKIQTMIHKQQEERKEYENRIDDHKKQLLVAITRYEQELKSKEQEIQTLQQKLSETNTFKERAWVILEKTLRDELEEKDVELKVCIKELSRLQEELARANVRHDNEMSQVDLELQKITDLEHQIREKDRMLEQSQQEKVELTSTLQRVQSEASLQRAQSEASLQRAINEMREHNEAKKQARKSLDLGLHPIDVQPIDIIDVSPKASPRNHEDMLTPQTPRGEDFNPESMTTDLERELGEVSTEVALEVKEIKNKIVEAKQAVFKTVRTKQIQEMLVYNVPADAMLHSVRAIGYLLGFTKNDLRTWQQCKKVVKDVLRKLSQVDPTSGTAQRFKSAKEELQGLDYETCLKSGLAVASFFSFTTKMLEVRERYTKLQSQIKK